MYSTKKTIARPTLVLDEDIDKLDAAGLVDLLTKLQTKKEALMQIPGGSRRIAREIKEHDEAIAIVTAKLDEGEPPAEPTVAE